MKHRNNLSLCRKIQIYVFGDEITKSSNLAEIISIKKIYDEKNRELQSGSTGEPKL